MAGNIRNGRYRSRSSSFTGIDECEITGIPATALRGSLLSGFSVAERMSWTEYRKTTYKADKAYSLLGIFDVYMPLIYGKGKDRAMQRLREEIEKASKGHKHEDFSVTFSLSDISDVEHFVARKTELIKIHQALSGDGSRRAVVLHGLGGIGKTQLSIAYAKRHKDNYSAIFWLNIKDEDSLKQSFAKLDKQISREHPSAIRVSNLETNQNINEVVESIKSLLSLPNNTRWLMIYDNYDNLVPYIVLAEKKICQKRIYFKVDVSFRDSRLANKSSGLFFETLC
ncbi:hypothetical protein ACEPPN_012218 [Leptodophora sp. 'Broadleaf-Isolate-01']